jgi:hypothetical protein
MPPCFLDLERSNKYSGLLYVKRKGAFTSIRMHSNSDNKHCRRMRGIKLSAVGECAECD